MKVMMIVWIAALSIAYLVAGRSFEQALLAGKIVLFGFVLGFVGANIPHSARFRPTLGRRLFFLFVTPQPHHKVVEIDLVAVEIGPVDAREFDHFADLHATSTAHTGSVDHDRVEADHRLNA